MQHCPDSEDDSGRRAVSSSQPGVFKNDTNRLQRTITKKHRGCKSNDSPDREFITEGTYTGIDV
jgi:hypothetical protein